MKTNSIYISLVITVATLVMASFEVAAQDYYSTQLTLENINIVKDADVTNISLDINLNNLNIDKNELLIITPIVVSNSSENKKELDAITIIGKRRNRVLQRPFTYEGKPNIDIANENTLIRNNESSQLVSYTTSLPYEEWQRDAQLLISTEVIGCANCRDYEPEIIVTDRILTERFVPEYQFSYITPEVEEIKERSETYSAHLNYVVGRWDLLPGYENNAAVLAKVDDIIQELKGDNDLTISNFTITGYASPEGTQQSNLLLSQRRAQSFAKHIEAKYGYNSNQFKVEWKGEDWNGLREAIISSDLANKNDIIDIISSVSDIDARDGRIRAFDNEVTYNRILNELYPPLRRNDYNIAFVSRPFDVEEAAEVIKTRPKLLSLNEMFHVANTFPAESAEYREVFEVAAKTFPESETANINVAVTELNNNNIDAALERLEKMKDSPAAWNMLGVAYAQKDMDEQAEEYFNKAIEQGDEDALHNLQQLERYVQDK
ncbi:MAG: DUF3868 domain-containing protein [Fermentimonas sp.]|nr:DUF3868 domain-containing protein [Fermentimonas sp.]